MNIIRQFSVWGCNYTIYKDSTGQICVDVERDGFKNLHYNDFDSTKEAYVFCIFGMNLDDYR